MLLRACKNEKMKKKFWRVILFCGALKIGDTMIYRVIHISEQTNNGFCEISVRTSKLETVLVYHISFSSLTLVIQVKNSFFLEGRKKVPLVQSRWTLQ